MMYERGEGTPVNASKAVSLYQKACSLGAANACTSYGYMIEKGHGTPRDPSKALTYYEKGCNGGNSQGCSNMGVMYEQGLGLPSADLGRAGEYYEKACKAGLNDACSYLSGLIQRMKNDREPSKQTLDAFAAPGKGKGKVDKTDCTNIGYLYERGVGVPADARMAAEVLQTRLRREEPGELLEPRHPLRERPRHFARREEGRRALQKSCDLGGASGCNNLGFALERGRGLRADPKKALVHYKKGCDMGSQRACDNARILASHVEKKSSSGFIEIPERKSDAPPAPPASLSPPGGATLGGVRRLAISILPLTGARVHERGCATTTGRSPRAAKRRRPSRSTILHRAARHRGPRSRAPGCRGTRSRRSRSNKRRCTASKAPSAR